MALADETLRLARPLGVLVRRSKREDFARLAQLVRAHGVTRIVVGQPLRADGSEGPRAHTAARWAAALAQALGAVPPGAEGGIIPAKGEPPGLIVVLWDESGSTLAAGEVRRAQGKRVSDPRTHLDAVAAAVILQDYLDAQPQG